MKIVDTYWFGHVGIVKVYTGYDTRWYIGVGQGHDESADAAHIAQWGQPFHPNSLQYFFQPVEHSGPSRTERFDSDGKSYM